MKYIFIENGLLNGAGESKCLSNDTVNFEVSDELYDEYCKAPDKYIFSEGEIIENPDYESIKLKKENEIKASQLHAKLDELDIKRVRALCESEVKDEKTGQTWLDYYNSEVQKIRSELGVLEPKI